MQSNGPLRASPKPITAADKQSFNAIGMGDIYINMPNRESESLVLLKDILYTPSMGVRLVSISHITAARSTIIFSGGSCQIFDSMQRLLGCIEANHGLYCVYTVKAEMAGYAGQVKEVLTIEEL